MESFHQLLNQYVQRVGISDAELARTLGVSRQTIFRWREGLTGRPRQREDVLTLAQKLRLTLIERDKLLLAAGFSPANGGAEESEDRKKTEDQEQNDDLYIRVDAVNIPLAKPLPYSQGLIAILGGLLLLGIFFWLFYGKQREDLFTASPVPEDQTPISVVSSAQKTLTAVAPAAPGETLVLVTHFANYAGSQIGYNVAGRLAQALQQEIETIKLKNARVAIWPQAVGERREAFQAGQTVSATLVIYGEYDVGRVIVQFVQPADPYAFTDPALQRQVADVPTLSATINTDLPQQVRSLALMALGQIFIGRMEIEKARPLLIQARDNLQTDPQVEPQTWALANFFLGIAYQHSQPPLLDETIATYTQAINAWPEMITSRLNRIAAYVARRQPGDLELALADADQVINSYKDWPAAYNNRATIRMSLGGTENLALAEADLNKALALDTKLPEAYLNRAFVHFQQELPMVQVAPDLTQTLTLRPNYAPAFNMFCLGYGVEQQPELALPYCQQAVVTDPQPLFLDSRGVTYAQLGDYQAALTDLQTYRDWLEEQQGEAWQPAIVRRKAWIKALQTGQNPFTSAALRELRSEFGR